MTNMHVEFRVYDANDANAEATKFNRCEQQRIEMSTCTITTRTPLMPTDTAMSSIMLPIVEREVCWRTHNGDVIPLDGHKVLVRQWNGTGPPDGAPMGGQPITVVSNAYRLTHVMDLLGAVETALIAQLPTAALVGIQLKDSEAYNGRLSIREYVFNGMLEVIDAQCTVAFRLVVAHSYGGKSIELYNGAREFHSQSSMITGECERIYRRNRQELRFTNLSNAIESFVRQFYIDSITFRRWGQRRISAADGIAFIQYAFIESVGGQNALIERYKQEMAERGETLWALYSALIYGATHPLDPAFGLRRVDRHDSWSAKLLEQERRVHRLTRTTEWKKLEGRGE